MAPRLLVFMDNLVIRINEPGKFAPFSNNGTIFIITWR
jgi:hypothetical protein